MSIINEFQEWLYTISFGALGLLVIGNNIWVLFQSKIKNESTSFTLFIGAFFGVLSFLTAPIDFIKWLAFVPIIIDPGTGLVIYTIIKNRKNG